MYKIWTTIEGVREEIEVERLRFPLSKLEKILLAIRESELGFFSRVRVFVLGFGFLGWKENEEKEW